MQMSKLASGPVTSTEPPMNSNLTVLPDALRQALGQVIARERQEWKRDRELIASEAGRAIAEFKAEISELRFTIKEMASERLGAVKDGRDGKDGADGRDGERGAPGERGERGEQGLQGPQGERGADGDRGADGATGAPGQPGEPGPAGPQGPEGERGADGQAGEAGERGLQGEPGERGEKGETGSQGPEGRGFTVRGTYAPERDYYIGDIVMLNGSSFVAQRNVPGHCPGNGWQLWASVGRTGKPGDRGESGQRGERGLPGPAVIGGTFDVKEMKLILVRDDSEKITIDAYPFAETIRSA
jgi:hypothetical protein